MSPVQTSFEEQLFRTPEPPVQQPCTTAAESLPEIDKPSAEFAQIWDLLGRHRGQEASITAPDIADALGLFQDSSKSNRGTKIRKVIEHNMDLWPGPICGDVHGYFLPTEADELSHYDSRLTSVILCMFRRRKTNRRLAPKVGFSHLGHGRFTAL